MSKKQAKTAALKNMVANRFQLNSKRNVGPTSQSIREAQPDSLEAWEDYYYEHVRSREHIEALGNRMYEKIHQVIIPALESISPEECQQYIHELVITKTYQGYVDEIEAVRDLVATELSELPIEIEPAPDEMDRVLAVDFIIRVGDNLVGLQVKPITADQVPDLHKWESIWRRAHEEFKNRFGGKVFTVYNVRRGQEKSLHDPEVSQQIKREIARLQKET